LAKAHGWLVAPTLSHWRVKLSLARKLRQLPRPDFGEQEIWVYLPAVQFSGVNTSDRAMHERYDWFPKIP